MITKHDFSKMITMECELLLKQVEGLTHADSLLQPQTAGNCLNWTIGHLVVNLVDILKVLGGETPSDLLDLAHYGYGSEPVRCDGPGVINFQVLVDAYTHLTTLITDHLAQMTEVDFDQDIDFWQGKSRRGYVAFFYFFHNTYHLGQLELFRNLAGRTDKVI
jgi:hypothetical protein